MPDYTLSRTGDSDLSFTGQLVAETSTHSHQGPSQNRWFEIAIYRTDSGKWVVAIGYRSIWQGEQNQDFATVYAEPAEVREYLRKFDPCSESLWQGIPAQVHDADRRNHTLRSTIATAWRVAVSEVLAGEEFAERVV